MKVVREIFGGSSEFGLKRRTLLGMEQKLTRPAASCPALQLRFTAWFIAWLMISASAAFSASFTTTLDRDTTSVGESVTLSLTFEGGGPKATPNIPGMTGLAFQPAGQSTKYSIINGRTSGSVIYNYLVTPTAAGEYTIPAFETVIDGKKVTSQPLKLKVNAAAAPGSQEDALKQFAFVKLILPKTEMYVGEILPLEIRAYFFDAEIREAPQLKSDGFTFGKLTQVQPSRTQIGNNIYQLYPFKLSASAAKTGKLALGPAQFNLTLKIPVNNRRRTDPFDDAFGAFFGNRVQLVPRTLESESFTINVLPLPRTNVPPGFSGAVGNFTMSVTVSPTNIAVGDPITIKTQVTGAGALDNLALPTLDAWKEFKSYPATSKIETSDELGLQGTKSFEQVVVPQNTEIKLVPEVTFSFFDPDQKCYRTLRQPPTPVVVRPAGATQLPPSIEAGASSPRETSVPQDIVHIKPTIGAVSAIAAPLLQQRWFLALQGVPLAGFFAAFLWRKRNERLANNPRLRRKRQVAQTVQAGLAELRGHAAENRAEDFFATVFRLMQEQLGERLDLPATAITEAVIEEQLRPRGASAEILAALHELFQTCNQARYGGHRSAEELAELSPKVAAALKGLQKLPDDL